MSALGSNLGDRLGTLRAATRLLRDGAVPGTALVRCSPVYETRPLGPSSGFVLERGGRAADGGRAGGVAGGVARARAAHGRTRRERWEARTLDLDMLVWEGEGVVRLAGPALRLPHPELARRDFVLAPLAALAPELRPRGGRRWPSCWRRWQRGERTIVAQLTELLC
jgi:2-amino-4-hydroxy-6-hydroxymethyldihydropteridine diphosphokinase